MPRKAAQGTIDLFCIEDVINLSNFRNEPSHVRNPPKWKVIAAKNPTIHSLGLGDNDQLTYAQLARQLDGIAEVPDIRHADI